MAKATLRGKHLIVAGLQFRGSIHCHHGGKHDSMQADVVLEKEPRVPHLDPQEGGETVSHNGHSLSIGDLKACLYGDILPSIRPHHLNSATP